MSRMVSPNELHAAACKEYGKPETDTGWAKIVNFWAVNVQGGLEVSACLLMKRLYACPLSDRYVSDIARFQADRKGGKHASDM